MYLRRFQNEKSKRRERRTGAMALEVAGLPVDLAGVHVEETHQLLHVEDGLAVVVGPRACRGPGAGALCSFFFCMQRCRMKLRRPARPQHSDRRSAKQPRPQADRLEATLCEAWHLRSCRAVSRRSPSRGALPSRRSAVRRAARPVVENVWKWQQALHGLCFKCSSLGHVSLQRRAGPHCQAEEQRHAVQPDLYQPGQSD